MVSFWLIAGAAASVAAGVYTLFTRRLPPIFPDGQGNRGAPDIQPSAAPRWGLGFIAFGVALMLLAFLGAAYSRAV